MKKSAQMLFGMLFLSIFLAAFLESQIMIADCANNGVYPMNTNGQSSGMDYGDPHQSDYNFSYPVIDPIPKNSVSNDSITDQETFSATFPEIIDNQNESNIANENETIDIREYSNNLSTTLNNIGNDKKILIPSGTIVNITSDILYPENVSIIVERGGSFNISNGKKLVINGELIAGLYKIFETNNNGKVYFGTKGTGKSTRIVYPQWWGAIADGVVDDSLAIDMASRSLSPNGGTVYFSPGTYAIKYNIYIYQSNTTFRGEGETSVIKAIANDLHLISIEEKRNIVIEKLYLDGNYKTSIRFQLSGEPAGSGETYIGNAQAGIYFNKCNNIIIKDCCLVNFGYPSNEEHYWGFAIFGMQENRNITVRDNIIEGGKNKRGGGDILLWQSRSYDVSITGNRLSGQVDIHIQVFNIDPCGRIIITNNIIQNGGRHGIMVTYGGKENKDAIIANNIISNTGSTGIYNNGGSSILINGNILHSCSGNAGDGSSWGNGVTLSGAIFCSGQGEKIITNNYIYNTGRNPDGTPKEGYGDAPVNASCAIRIGAPGGNSLIANNIIDNSIGHGIIIYHYWNSAWGNPKIAHLNSLICGNRIVNIDGYGLYVQNSGTSYLKHLTIDQNYVEAGKAGIWMEYNICNNGNCPTDLFDLHDNVFIGNKNRTGYGIMLRQSPIKGKIKNNYINNWSIGGYIYADVANLIGDAIDFSDNIITNCKIGIWYYDRQNEWSFGVNNNVHGNDINYRPENFDHWRNATSIYPYKIFYDNSPPKTGVWKANDMIVKQNPKAGGNSGWVCTVAGNPGTWSPIGIMSISTTIPREGEVLTWNSSSSQWEPRNPV